MAVLPTCDGFVTGVREEQFLAFDVWEFRFDGSSRPIGPGIQISSNAVLHVTQDGHVLAVDNDWHAAEVHDLTTGALLFSLPPPVGRLMKPIGVLFDSLFVFLEGVGSPTLDVQVTVRDSIGDILWIEPPPVGALAYRSFELSPSGDYLLSNVHTTGGSPLGFSHWAISADGLAVAFDTPTSSSIRSVPGSNPLSAIT